MHPMMNTNRIKNPTMLWNLRNQHTLRIAVAIQRTSIVSEAFNSVMFNARLFSNAVR